MSELEKIISEVHEWQLETFKNADQLSKLHHLKEEVNELISEAEFDKAHKKHYGHLDPRGSAIRSEYADCFLLLFGSAMVAGYSLDDITELIKEKHEINKKRKWGKPDENGVVKHIKDNG